jgi:prefoldin subunit 5
MMIINSNEDYLKQKLEWVAQRMAALEEIEARLREMRSLAAYAKDNHVSPEVAHEFNARLRVLQREITALDKQTRVFWMDCQ